MTRIIDIIISLAINNFLTTFLFCIATYLGARFKQKKRLKLFSLTLAFIFSWVLRSIIEAVPYIIPSSNEIHALLYGIAYIIPVLVTINFVNEKGHKI